jgi:hypothetical protein
MWLATLRNLVFTPRSGRRPAPQRCRARVLLEQLEDRALPSAYTAGSVADLIADIKAANAVGGSNTITLAAGTTFTLTAVDNTADGATALPVIAAKDNLTIAGNGDTIARSNAGGTPAFRLLDLAPGASLTLQNLTLQGGLAWGDGVWAEGGAIYSQGTLTLNGVTVQNNQALGEDGGQDQPGSGAAGGGIYIAGGTCTLANVALNSNSAQGGNGGHHSRNATTSTVGGWGRGGGLYVAAGSVSLFSTTVDHNTAKGGHAGDGPLSSDGLGQGGGLYIQALASVSLDAFTQANVTHNSASTSNPDIFGSYTTSP